MGVVHFCFEREMVGMAGARRHGTRKKAWLEQGSMAPVRSHGTRKGCHYYTTLGGFLAVYSSGRACPCHARLPLPCPLAPAMPACPCCAKKCNAPVFHFR